MIIQFSKDICLNDWQSSSEGPIYFYRLSMENGKYYINNKCYVDIIDIDKSNKMITFYNELEFMNRIFCSNISESVKIPRIIGVEADISLKQYIDDFIIKMSKLKAFI